MKMKKYAIAAALILAIFMVSCEQKFPVAEPDILMFKNDSVPTFQGKSVRFEFEVIADYAVLWSGVEGNNYNQHVTAPSLVNTGTQVSLELNDSTGTWFGAKFFNYDTVGTFTAVLEVTSVGDFGETILRATEELEVNVQPAPGE